MNVKISRRRGGSLFSCQTQITDFLNAEEWNYCKACIVLCEE